MTWVAKAGGLGVSGWLSSAYAGGGILGADVALDGTSGGSPAGNDSLSAGSEYYWRIVTPPASGTLVIDEQMRFVWTPAGSIASASFVYALYEDYQLAGIATAYMDVGMVGEVTGDATGDSGTVSGGASVAGLSQASGGATGDSGSVGGAAIGITLSPGETGASYVVSASGRRWEVIAAGTHAAENQVALWPAKYPNERINAAFDFRPDLVYGDAVAGAVMTVSTIRGADAVPLGLLFGNATIKGGRVFHALAGGTIDCSYLVECQVTTLKGAILVLAGVLAVKPF